MTDLRKAAEMALEALEDLKEHVTQQGSTPEHWDSYYEKQYYALEALRQALAQPKQEPVAWVYRGNFHPFNPSDWAEGETATPLYTAPPKREWVGLTDAEVEAWRGNYDFFDSALVREVEAKLKEKNSG